MFFISLLFVYSTYCLNIKMFSRLQVESCLRIKINIINQWIILILKNNKKNLSFIGMIELLWHKIIFYEWETLQFPTFLLVRSKKNSNARNFNERYFKITDDQKIVPFLKKYVTLELVQNFCGPTSWNETTFLFS